MLSVRPKPAAIAIIGILILGVALSASLHLVPLPPKTYAATHYITLNGSAAKGWNDTVPGPIINVTENDSVIMTLTSTEIASPGMTVNMGPQHPSTHGVLRLIVELDGEVVISCRPVIGYLYQRDLFLLREILYAFRFRVSLKKQTVVNWAGVLRLAPRRLCVGRVPESRGRTTPWCAT